MDLRRVMRRQSKAGSYDERGNYSRFLAEVKIFFQKLDKAKLDHYMRPSAVLDVSSQRADEWNERSRKEKMRYLNCLEHSARSSDGKVLARLWRVWRNLQRVESDDVGWESWNRAPDQLGFCIDEVK